MLKKEKKITVKEFLQMEFEGEDAYYELINGIIVRKAAPTIRHQEILQNINFALSKYVRSKKSGKIFVAPVNIYLNKNNHVMPDIFFVSNKNKKILDYQEGGVMGVPDLIVEILSPGTLRNDKFDKKNAYENSGVKEYWLVDPKYKAVEVYENTNGRFEPFSIAEEAEAVKSKILKGFELDVKDIFTE